MPKGQQNSRTTIVTVSYNSLGVLPSMLETVPQGTAVVIVDNGSKDTDRLKKLADEHGASLILNEKNVGFGTACNQGAELAKTDYLLFLNPDARLEPSTLPRLEEAAGKYPKVSAMNPRIANSDGSAYFKRRSQLLPKSDWMPRGWPEADTEVSVLTGAALFTPREDFEAIGGFDPEIFLYHEDDDLAIRLKRDRGPIMFIHGALVTHASGYSTERSPQIAALKAWHMGRSRVYAAKKHGMVKARRAAIAQALLQALSPINLFSARKRAKHWAFLEGAISVD